jgi:hypothetical protein
VRHWAVLQTPGPAAVRRLTRGPFLRENRTGRRVVTVLRFTGSWETARDRTLLGPIAILFGAAGIVRELRNR